MSLNLYIAGYFQVLESSALSVRGNAFAQRSLCLSLSSPFADAYSGIFITLPGRIPDAGAVFTARPGISGWIVADLFSSFLCTVTANWLCVKTHGDVRPKMQIGAGRQNSYRPYFAGTRTGLGLRL